VQKKEGNSKGKWLCSELITSQVINMLSQDTGHHLGVLEMRLQCHQQDEILLVLLVQLFEEIATDPDEQWNSE
jgi:hypothetical protein